MDENKPFGKIMTLADVKILTDYCEDYGGNELYIRVPIPNNSKFKYVVGVERIHDIKDIAEEEL